MVENEIRAGYRLKRISIGTFVLGMCGDLVVSMRYFSGVLSLVPPDDFEVYADVFVLFCDFQKVFWRVRQLIMKILRARNFAVRESEEYPTLMCRVIDVGIKNATLPLLFAQWQWI